MLDWANPAKTIIASPGSSAGYSAINCTTSFTGFSGPLCPDSLGGANPRTIEAWVYRVANQGTIFDISRQYTGAASDGQFSFTAWDSWAIRDWQTVTGDNDAGSHGYGQTVPQGQWVHLAVTYDGTTLTPYVNGVAGATKTYTYNTQAGNAMTIGNSRYGSATTAHSFDCWDGWMAYTGYMGAIRVYDSVEDVPAHFAMGVNYGETAVTLWKITPSVSGSGGTISPSGIVYVPPGATQTFTITPDLYFDVTNVITSTVGSVLAGPATQIYAMANVTAEDTIVASFEAWVPTYITGTVTAGETPLPGVEITATGPRGPFVTRACPKRFLSMIFPKPVSGSRA